MKKIVVFGGGTGLSYLLNGLKEIDAEIVVAVSIADNGGSTGKIRGYYDIPAPGDLRRAVLALSDNPNIEDLMNYRFDEKIEKHTIGNLVLAALVDLKGNMQSAVEEYCDLVQVKHKILSISNQSLDLKATMKNNEVVIGEEKLASHNQLIEKIEYNQVTELNEAVLKEIETADAVVLSSGSLYTSIIPNIIFEDIQKIIKEKNIKTVYAANIMTEKGETEGYSLSQHIDAINKHLELKKIDVVIANNNYEIPADLEKLYREEKAYFVRSDIENIKTRIVLDDFITISDDYHVRHNTMKLSRAIEKEL